MWRSAASDEGGGALGALLATTFELGGEIIERPSVPPKWYTARAAKLGVFCANLEERPGDTNIDVAKA